MLCKVFVGHVLLTVVLSLFVQAEKEISKSHVDEKKLKEIAAIREQLNEAFERDVDMKSVGKGVIVQPEWTQSNAKAKGSAKVVVNEKNLKTAAEIRDQIQDAVKAGKHVTGESGHEASYQKPNAQSKNGQVGSVVASEEAKDELVGFEGNLEDNEPNFVESTALGSNIDLEELKKLEMTNRRTRDKLVLREIVEDLSFDVGDDVREWEHLYHGGREYFIGLRDTDLIVIESTAMTYGKGEVISVEGSISFLETLSYWNTESKEQEGLILVTVDDEVVWFKVDSKEVIWRWRVGASIVSVKHFQVQQKDYLAISSESFAMKKSFFLTIYQLDLKNKEFWIAQKLHLEDLCPEVAILDTGKDLVLTVVQNNSVVMYTFTPFSDIGDHIRFERKGTIQSQDIQSVSGFQMGGHSYVAIGGRNPQILLYSNDKLVPKTILDMNFGLVELFLPIPARTYRDDLILIVQHRAQFESHDLVVLDSLIWDGEAFENSPPPPCIASNHTFAYGVGCMLDVQRDSGIKGSAVLRRGNDIFIIVPRHDAESGLFQLKTELLKKNSELEDLRGIFEFFQNWVKGQDELTEEAHRFLESPDVGVDFQDLSLLQTPELIFDGQIDHIFVNGQEFTNEDMAINLEDLVQAIETAEMKLSQEEDSARQRRELSYDTLDFDRVEVDDLNVQLLNGEKPYLRNLELTFDGTVSFENLTVLDKVELGSPRLNRDDSVEIIGDLQFEKINGIPWNDLLSDLVFRDRELELEKLQVDGEVIVEGDMEIQKLNDLKFPTDFMWTTGEPTNVMARKIFFSTVTLNQVDIKENINGVDPFDVITLGDTQTIPGLTTFSQLEVSQGIEVDGKVQGRGLSDFLANPSLQDSNIVHSACTFYNLQVEGPIVVSDKLNGNNLDAVLEDIVYRPAGANETITIESQKIFNSITFDSSLEVKDNSLSGVPLADFITKNTDQDLEMENIVGNVYFNSLTITGKYDSVDVDHFLRNSIPIDRDFNVDMTIEFLDRVWAQSLDIVKSLNGKSGFRTLHDDFELDEATFEDVQVSKASLDCNITGSGTINSVNLNHGAFHGNSKIHATELILESDLQVESLHDINATLLLSFLQGVDNIPAMILEGKILANSIHVDGDVQVNKLNGHDFDDDIQRTTIWLNRPNFLSTTLKFQEPIAIAGDLQINGSLNEFNIPFLIGDMAFKSDGHLIITSPKHFLVDVNVLYNADVESVNDLPFTEIATKQTMETFQGTVHINGDMMVENLLVLGFLNDYALGDLGSFLRYDEDRNSFVLLGKVIIKGRRDLGDLHINGRLNSIGNVNEFFENIVYKNRICMLKGKTTFAGNVTIERGAYIRYLNGYNLAQLMKNIVLVNNPKPIVISAPVVFKEVVYAKDVTVKGSLTTSNLMGCPLKEWLEDTLRVDREAEIGGIAIFAPGALDGNSLEAIYLNGMNMDDVITLNTPQNISHHLGFSDVYLNGAIEVEGLVNGVDVTQEFENTVMVSGNQDISTPLTLTSCSVTESLLAHSATALHGLATLHENLKFISPISFTNLTVNNVVTDDLISGINFNKWHRNSLWIDRRHPMVVTGNWTVKNLYVESPFIRRTASDVGRRSRGNPLDEVRDQYDQLYEAYNQLCQRGKQLYQKTRNRIYFLKYFEKTFNIVEEHDISGLFSITNQNRTYVIINSNCESRIYLWETENQSFKRISDFESGVIQEIIAVPGKGDAFHLVTNEQSRNSRCSRAGVNTWYFSRDRVAYVRSFNENNITTIHRPTQAEGKFYAIEERRGQVLQLFPNSTERQSWSLPHGDHKLFRFMPHDADLGIALANGHQILLLNEPSRRRFRRRRDSLYNHHTSLEFSSRTVIPPGKNLTFSDFRHVIERILRDLIRRLNIQLSDINFTLAEGELDDEHLRKDFMDILEAIRIQNILPPETFADLHVEELEFSSNPTQILAARIVQLIWPVLVEIEEVHTHLRSGDDDHPVCGGIFNSLSSAVHDVLAIARFSTKSQSELTGSSNITEIITRIQAFQKEILTIIDKLGKDPNSPEAVTDAPPSSPEGPARGKLLHFNATLRNPLDEPFIGQAIPEKNLLAAEGPHLPARGSGEIVSVKTGMATNQRTLIAITASEGDSVKIFFDVITGSLFQTVSANKPRYLTSTRIQDESLLAFVEDRKHVRVLIYQGTKGFVEFVKFTVENEISGLSFVRVAGNKVHECPRNYLMVSSGSRVDFYEAFMSGQCGLDGEVKCSSWLKS